jgi:hypothetical protein
VIVARFIWLFAWLTAAMIFAVMMVHTDKPWKVAVSAVAAVAALSLGIVGVDWVGGGR